MTIFCHNNFKNINPIPLMRNLIVLLAALSFFASCAPKHTASFYYYNKSDYSGKGRATYSELNTQSNSEILVVKENLNNEELTTQINSSTPIYASASTKIEPLIFKQKDFQKESNNLVVEKVTTASEKKVLKKQLKSMLVAPSEGGDSKKNGLAIAGFVTSLGGILFLPLAFVGIALSVIGLKSEKRVLAIAGLVVGIVVIAFWLIMLVSFFVNSAA